ncbi:MAG: hypothetical protein J5940_03475 [Clostridia bacterium]|nr:hypothetical protein [Clostridia bacterium]
MKTSASVSKTFNTMGLVVHIVYFVLAIISLCCYYTQSPPAEGGLPLAFRWWFWSTIVAAVCIFFYLIGAVSGIIAKRDTLEKIKLVIVVGAIPMWGFGVGHFVVWNVFFVILFAVELIPLIIEFKKKNRKQYVVQTSPLPVQEYYAADDASAFTDAEK